MAVNITYRLPTEDDINQLANNLRQTDLDELLAVTDETPLEAIIASVHNSNPDFLFAAFADKTLLCIGGCTRTGNPWLLGTPDLQRHLYRLTKAAKHGVRMMLTTYPILTNMVDVRNVQTIRWLETIGFTMCETLEVKTGYPVIRFQKVRDECTLPNSS